jgi:hypothetical protein
MSSRLLWRHSIKIKSFKGHYNRFRTHSSQSITDGGVSARNGQSKGIRPSIAIGEVHFKESDYYLFLFIEFIAGTLAFSIAGYTIGSFYPPELVTLVNPRSSSPLPPEPLPLPLSEESIESTKLEKQLQNLPLLQSLRNSKDSEEWYEVRPYRFLEPDKKIRSLTAGSLGGIGKIGISPLVRAKKDESESVVILHVGRKLCGHDGIVHGGFIATVLDESMGRVVSFFFFLIDGGGGGDCDD